MGGPHRRPGRGKSALPPSVPAPSSLIEPVARCNLVGCPMSDVRFARRVFEAQFFLLLARRSEVQSGVHIDPRSLRPSLSPCFDQRNKLAESPGGRPGIHKR